MERLLRIFLTNGSFFVFFALELFCFWLIIHFNSPQSEIAAETWALYGGWARSGRDRIDEYLDLREENKLLQRENARLRSLLPSAKYDLRTSIDSITDDSLLQRYTLLPARIINRTPRRPNNTFVVDRGAALGVASGQGVIDSEGLLGIVDIVSARYARIISILHRDIRISAGLKNGVFGTLRWDGKDPKFMDFYDIPSYIDTPLNDTIFTTGYSNVFPSKIPIGTILHTEDEPGTGTQLIRIKLLNEPLRSKNAYIVQDLFKEELERLNQQP